MDVEELLRVPVARLQERFRSREARLRVEAPVVVRLDGVGFSRLPSFFEAPRDPRVHKTLVKAARILVERYGVEGAHVFSDEINLYMLSDPLPYGGRVEKICSIPASIAAAEASLRLGIPLYFDGRVVSLEHSCEAIAYTLFRMRVGLGNYARQLAAKIGIRIPDHMKLRELLDMLEDKGSGVEVGWRSTGTFLYWRGEKGEGRSLVETSKPGEFLEAIGKQFECVERETPLDGHLTYI